MATDFIINIAEMPYQKSGNSAWRKHAKTLYHAVPDVNVQIEDGVAADDKVAVRMRIKGIHRGEFLGQPGTGRAIDYVSHDVYRFKDEKLAEEWICSDSSALRTQIGVLSKSGLVSMWFSGYRLWFGVAIGKNKNAKNVRRITNRRVPVFYLPLY